MSKKAYQPTSTLFIVIAAIAVAIWWGTRNGGQS